MNIKNVVVAGGGVLGSQIAFQSAFSGFDVTIWLRSEESVTRTKPKLDRLYSIYLQELEGAKNLLADRKYDAPRAIITNPKEVTLEEIEALKIRVEEAYKSIKLIVDMKEAVKDADLVIEAMAENPQAKMEFYQKLAPFLPEKTIVATNSSSMIPSMFRDYTGRPEKFLAIHFANNIWRANTAEIMGHDGTDKEAYDLVVKFAEDIKMVPLKLFKEQAGYILNTMLIPFLNAGQVLLAKEVSDPATIDLTWRLGTGAQYGPFQILDIVGLTTAYNIVSMNPEVKNPESIPAKIAKILKDKIDEGKTGINAGEGFYKYR